MEKRIKEEFKVNKIEFFMGDNDPVDRRCGGPATLALWIYTSLPNDVITKVALDGEVQEAIRIHGGSGGYHITEAWAEKFVEKESDLKTALIELAKQF